MFNKFSKYLKKGGPLIIFLLMVLLVFWPTLTGQKSIYLGDFSGSDLTELNYPLRAEAGQSIRNGQIPTWTQEISHGFPLLAEGQAGVFYPINLLLFPFLPASLAYNWSVVINFLLGGLFFYFFARAIKIKKEAAWLGAIVFSFSGFFVARLKHINMVNVAVWLPLTLFFIEKFFRTKKTRWLAWLAIIGSIQILAGHLHMAYYCLLITFSYFLVRMVIDFRQQQRSSNKKIVGQLFGRISLIIIVGIAIVLLAAVQILPSLEMIQFNEQIEGRSYESATAFPFSPRNFVNFLIPYYWGNPANASYVEDLNEAGVFWENSVYIGFFGIILALYGIFACYKNRYTKVFLGILVACLLLVLGHYTPVYRIIWATVPGMDLFRFPNRFIIGIVLSLAVFVGLAWGKISEKLNSYFIKKYNNPKAISYLTYLVMFLIVLDLYIFASSYFLITDSNKYYEKPQSVEFFQEQQIANSPFRIYSFGTQQSWPFVYQWAQGWKGDFDKMAAHREVLQPDYNLLWNVEQIGERAFIEGGVNFPRMVEFLNKQLNEGVTSYTNEGSISTAHITEKLTKTMGLENVKYLTSFYKLDSPKLEQVKMIKFADPKMLPAYIYENQDWLPRALAINKVRVVKEQKEILDTIFSEDFNPSQEIIIEKEVGSLEHNEDWQAQVEISKYSNREVIINTDYNQEGYLLLTDSYYPGWKATVNNQPTEILLADYIFQAVRIPAGQSEITFSYQPKSYYWGKIISLIALCLVILFLIFANKFEKINGRK